MLDPDELVEIETRLGRKPTPTELHVFDAMWSEHCSYKSTKYWLKQLPNKNKNVVCGPGENAGVVDIGDNEKIVFKIESHNHPSFIEPYQGAATGVGGIMRDIFTMGARPIANLNSLHFGSPNDTRVIHGVVKGIADYGNCIGVPTVSSKSYFGDCYMSNPLVNAMTVGYVKGDVFTSIPKSKGRVFYVGAKTGRDGIGGAIMASDSFDSDVDLRPTVQVGDPYYEKLLLEASLELFQTGAVVAAQDMGAAGILSSTTEVALKGGYGIEIDISKVPLRESHMEPWEILLSESQERMLFVLKDDFDYEQVSAIFKKWELDFTEIGALTDTGNFVVQDCNIALSALDAPELQRPYAYGASDSFTKGTEPFDQSWIYKQYDSDVMGNTVQKLWHDPAIIRIPNSNKSIAMTTVSNAEYCHKKPKEAIVDIISEAYNIMQSVGAKPLAITNCLNFGNPEQPHIMNQIVETIQGMKIICEELDLPVVSGNVSLYNETSGVNIAPTPVVGIVGLKQCVVL